MVRVEKMFLRRKFYAGGWERKGECCRERKNLYHCGTDSRGSRNVPHLCSYILLYLQRLLRTKRQKNRLKK